MNSLFPNIYSIRRSVKWPPCDESTFLLTAQNRSSWHYMASIYRLIIMVINLSTNKTIISPPYPLFAFDEEATPSSGHQPSNSGDDY